jgi:FkbM family methyltransferase
MRTDLRVYFKKFERFAKGILREYKIIDQKQTKQGNKKYVTIEDWELSIRKIVKAPVKKILPYIKNDSVLIDIGANVGTFTEAVLSKNRNVKAYLFEPVPQYYKWLQSKFSKYSNVKISELALSDELGEFPIWVDAINLGWNTMVSKKITDNMRKISINTIVFDDFVEMHNIQKIDAIKIDVEGLEYKVINGMKKTLLKLDKKPVILCEIGWGKNSHPNWDEEVKTFEWLFNNGYQRFNYNEIVSTKDVLFLPQ